MKSEFEKLFTAQRSYRSVDKEAFIRGCEAAYKHQQSKVDELQRRNQMLNDNIKEQGQKLVYQNEVIETQAEKLIVLRAEKEGLQDNINLLNEALYVKEQLNQKLREREEELQKRLNAALEVVKQGIRKQGIKKQGGDYYLEKVEELLEGGGC